MEHCQEPTNTLVAPFLLLQEAAQSSTTPWYKISGNARSYSFKINGDYGSNSGSLSINTSGTYSGSYRQEWCTYQGQVLEHSGTQCKYNGSWYPDTTAGVTVSRVDYNFLGSVGDTGQLSGTWSTVGGGASGSMSGSPSGSTINGQNTTASGAITTLDCEVKNHLGCLLQI